MTFDTPLLQPYCNVLLLCSAVGVLQICVCSTSMLWCPAAAAVQLDPIACNAAVCLDPRA